MRSAPRLLGSIFVSRVLALAFLPLGALAPSPASAYWYFGFTTGPTPYEVCVNWAAPGTTYTFVAIRPEFVNGQLRNYVCTFRYNFTGALSEGSVYQSCNAGEVRNLVAASGCSVVAPPSSNNFGGQGDSTAQCRTAPVGNPVSPLVCN